MFLHFFINFLMYILYTFFFDHPIAMNFPSVGFLKIDHFCDPRYVFVMPNINLPYTTVLYPWFSLVLVEVNSLIFHLFNFEVFWWLYIARWRNDLYNVFVATFLLSRMHVNNLLELLLKKCYKIKTLKKLHFLWSSMG